MVDASNYFRLSLYLSLDTQKLPFTCPSSFHLLCVFYFSVSKHQIRTGEEGEVEEGHFNSDVILAIEQEFLT